MFEVVACVFQTMQERSIELRRFSNVAKVVVQFQPMRCPDGPIIEGYVDVFLKDGGSVCWFLDVRWTGDAWMIDKSIEEKRNEHDAIRRELGTIAETDFDNFTDRLPQESIDLLQTTPSMIQLGS